MRQKMTKLNSWGMWVMSVVFSASVTTCYTFTVKPNRKILLPNVQLPPLFRTALRPK